MLKSILFLLVLTALVWATDHTKLIQQLNDYEAQLLSLEKSPESSEIHVLQDRILSIKSQLGQNQSEAQTPMALSAKASSSDLELVSAYLYHWDANTNRLVATVRNKAFIYAEWVKVHFYFYNNGALVGSDWTYIDFATYGDNGILPYHDSFLETYIDKMFFNDYEVVFEYDTDAAGQKAVFCDQVLQLLDVTVGAGPLADWSGTVNNSSPFAVESPRIFATFFKKENQIDLDMAVLDTKCQGNRTIIIDHVVDSPLEAQGITLRNCGDGDVNLGGWTLGNKINPYSYLIPANTIISAKDTLNFDNNDLNFTIGTENEKIYLSNSTKTQVDTWTKDEKTKVLEPFTSSCFVSYLNMPNDFDKLKYRLSYSLGSLTGDGNIAPNTPRFTLPLYSIQPHSTHSFELFVLDPNDDQVEFQIDWGDGTRTGWLGAVASRTLGKAEHSYIVEGAYVLSARARDIHGLVSTWSDSVSVFVDKSVPVELASFEASVCRTGIELNWHTLSESNNLGFDIERSLDKKQWQSIGFVGGQGTTVEPFAYHFTDTTPPGGHLYYRLRQIDTDGSFAFSGTVAVTMRALQFDIISLYPNPFNARTQIYFQLEERATVHIDVYNINGTYISTLLNDNLDAGFHSLTWHAEDQPSGAYIIKIQQQDRIRLKKCLLLK